MHGTKLSIVAAMAENRVIGKDNRLPWRIKEDLIHLRTLTQNHAIILGRKTFDSMAAYYDKSGKEMPGKVYIVITHNKEYQPTRSNVIMVHSIEEAITTAQASEDTEIFIIGGQHIFEQAIGKVDKLYLTIVKGNYEGDAYFPDYSDFKKVVSKQDLKEGEYSFSFLELERE